jgi:hypothetical protein
MKRVFLYVLGAMVIAAALGGFAAFGPPGLYAKSESPEFCGSCHVLRPEYELVSPGAHQTSNHRLPPAQQPGPSRGRPGGAMGDLSYAGCQKFQTPAPGWWWTIAGAATPSRGGLMGKAVRRHRRCQKHRRHRSLDPINKDGRRHETDGPIIVLAALAVETAWLSPVRPKSEPVKTATIPDGEYDPAVWGRAYPLEYDSWLKSKEPNPAGLSKYRKGWTGGEKFDKLSEFPYLALLFNGWGFGVEYNEIRGHYYMLIDQLEIDPSR